MLPAVRKIYESYNATFAQTPLNETYLAQYDQMTRFATGQPDMFSRFDRYDFIRNYVNPLFSLNQEMIRNYKMFSASYSDFALNDKAASIFDKSLYKAQTTKGIFSFVEDTAMLNDIRRIGKLLFYDPILSGNNKRSCASCHNPTGYFADSSHITPLAYEGKGSLQRNAPSLVNAAFNHLMMLDGRELTLQSQAHSVMT
jgi:cytochrome c peroxidase